MLRFEFWAIEGVGSTLSDRLQVLDDISFSPLPIPGPSYRVLLVLGSFGLWWARR